KGGSFVKPPAFEYYKPQSLDEALELLGRLGDEGKILAGGQSLIPAMNMRLIYPSALIDLAGLDELVGVSEIDGMIVIGGMTRQRVIETTPLIRERCPLIAETLSHVGYLGTRRRGTIGGSLAHADPAAELPAAMLVLEAEYEIVGADGPRWIPCAEFTLGEYTTVLEPDEILTRVRLRPLALGQGWSLVEYAPVHGAFATAGAAVIVSVGEGEECLDARIAVLGGEPMARRMVQAEEFLKGKRLEKRVLDEAQALVARDRKSGG